MRKTIRNDLNGSIRLALEALDNLDDLAVVELFRTHAPNTPAFNIVAPMLPALLGTIIKGALVDGPRGYNDRMTLFRMLGTPWTPAAQTGRDGGQQADGLGDRFVRAIARVERRLSGLDPVAVEPLTLIGAAIEAEDAA